MPADGNANIIALRPQAAPVYAAKPCAKSELRQLEADLDGLIQAHQLDTFDRLSVPMVEFNDDMGALVELARGIAQAAQAMAKLTKNNISADSPTQSPDMIAELLIGGLDGLLQLSAARLLEGAVAVRLAGGAL